jgi:hypothetical protein
MHRLLIGLCLAGWLAGCAGGDGGTPIGSTWDAVAGGAGYLTFDRTVGGCRNDPLNGNCNLFDGKHAAYLSGGPSTAGLADGDYFFAVLSPEYLDGFPDGAKGNLSDAVAGGTTFDLGSGDALANRTFRVVGHEIVSYAGTHAVGRSANGRLVVALAPFDDTDTANAQYALAVCRRPFRVGQDLVYPRPSGCRYDAFRVAPAGPADLPFVSGGKYYDANVNGAWDPGEVGIAAWPIEYSGHATNLIRTGADGRFSLQVAAGTYVFQERAPVVPMSAAPCDDDDEDDDEGCPAAPAWRQTGNRVSQLSVMDGATAALLADQTYTASVIDGSALAGLYFGNVCLGEGSGKSQGFWMNKHGEALATSADLALLRALELRTAAGAPFDPTTWAQFHDWLQAANASNMAYKLSAQLAVLQLNVAHGFVPTTALLWTDTDFVAVGALMDAANASLAAHGYTPGGAPARAEQTALKHALGRANGGGAYVQPDPAHCPAPHF